MSRLTRKADFICPTFARDDREATGTEPPGKFEGATVLTPKAGAYFTPITVLDFASLYPSVIMAENLCYSTVVMDERYNNLPGVRYETFNIDEKTKITFAQDVDSVLPKLLGELKTLRKRYKREMARCHEAGDAFEASVWDARQLAVKTSMNRLEDLLLQPDVVVLIAFAQIVLGPQRLHIGVVKACSLLIFNAEIKRCARMFVVDVPESVVAPRHTVHKLCFEVGSQIREIARYKVFGVISLREPLLLQSFSDATPKPTS